MLEHLLQKKLAARLLDLPKREAQLLIGGQKKGKLLEIGSRKKEQVQLTQLAKKLVLLSVGYEKKDKVPFPAYSPKEARFYNGLGVRLVR